MAAGVLGAAFAPLGLKPKHVALLSALELGAPGSQADLADLLRVTPSQVVLLVDHLETLDAVRRERDRGDRRRHHLILTASGRALLDEAQRAATRVDDELSDGFSVTDLAAVGRYLARFARAAGIPDADPAEDAAAR